MTTPPALDDLITLRGAQELIQSMGIPCSDRMIRRWADERRLPFFKWGSRLMISKHELIMHFRRLQVEAVNEVQKRRRER